MSKFLAIYNGAATDEEKQEMTPEDQQAFLSAWGEWAQVHGAALVDPGSPLFRKRLLKGTSVTEFEDSKTGYAIVEAESHDDAVDIFSTHPHLTLMAGNSIEVIECPAIPG